MPLIILYPLYNYRRSKRNTVFLELNKKFPWFNCKLYHRLLIIFQWNARQESYYRGHKMQKTGQCTIKQKCNPTFTGLIKTTLYLKQFNGFYFGLLPLLRKLYIMCICCNKSVKKGCLILDHISWNLNVVKCIGNRCIVFPLRPSLCVSNHETNSRCWTVAGWSSPNQQSVYMW